MPKKPKCRRFKHYKKHKNSVKSKSLPVLEAAIPRELLNSTSKDVEGTVSNSSWHEDATLYEHSSSVSALPIKVDTPPAADISDVAAEDTVTHISGAVKSHQNADSEEDFGCISSVVHAVQSDVGKNICGTNSVGEEATETSAIICYSTGKGLILDDVLSIAGLVDQEGAGKYEIVLVGAPESTHSFIEEQSMTSKWKDVEELLKPILPSHFKTHIENDCLSILALSRGTIKVVQRILLFKPDGLLEVYVHGKILKEDHSIFGKIGSLPSIRTMSAKVACDQVASVVKILREFQTCEGASDEKCERFWATTPGAFIEDGFEEHRYKRTLRPCECDYIVPQQFKRCQKCSTLQQTLRNKVKRAALKDEIVTPPKKKSNSCLYSAQKKKNFKRQQKDDSNLRPIDNRLDLGQAEDDVGACPLGISLFETLI